MPPRSSLEMLRPALWAFGWLIACAGMSSAQQLDSQKVDPKSLELFEKHVRPTLVEHCLRCHGAEKQQGGLRLDSREGWQHGGDTGPAVVPHDGESLILRAISYDHIELEMPPRGKLPDKTIEAFRRWVATGAADPRGGNANSDKETGEGEGAREALQVAQGKEFWSFQPVKSPPIPKAGDEWCATEIDHFLYARWQQAAVEPAEDAPPLSLLRRLCYDLTGLPPTPAQIDAFLADTSYEAYVALVDRLLESHHFGERWGRHWLDVVRFAESSGGGRTLLFPEAWRYRDYVIESFNRDLPYDRFVIEQIAGDLLPREDWQQSQRQLSATAFLLLGPINYEMQDKDILEMDIVDEQLDTIGKSMMGMTLGCARCHDHKFDPIPARDYYAMAGILKSTRSVVHSNVSQWNTVDLPLPPERQAEIEQHRAELARVKQKLQEATKRWEQAGGKKDRTASGKSIGPEQLRGYYVDDVDAERIGDWTESTSIARFIGDHYIHDAGGNRGQKKVVFRPKLESGGAFEVFVSYSASSNRSSRVPVHIHYRDGEAVVTIDQATPPAVDEAFVSVGTYDFDPAEDPRVIISNEGTGDGVVIADAVVWLPVDASSDELPESQTQRSLIESERSEKEIDHALLERYKSEKDRLAKEVEKLEKSAPKQPVLMATVDAEDPGDIHLAIRGQAHSKGPVIERGVLQVASNGDFPLIADGCSGRLEMARWMTNEDHPLTSRVMANRIWYWLMGRGIVRSVDNFGTMGDRPTHPELLDYLASRFVRQDWSVKQLIRDIVLSRAYRMSTQASVSAEQHDPENQLFSHAIRKRLRAEDIRDSLLLVSGKLDRRYGGSNIKPGTKIEYGYQFTSTRRSVYVPVFRNTLPEIFEVFDFADPNIQRGKRSTSTIASQALLLMNHPWVIERSREAAEQLLQKPLSTRQQRIDHVYREVLGRPPSDAEHGVSVDLIDSFAQNETNVDAWAMLYQVLFQSLDFRYLD